VPTDLALQRHIQCRGSAAGANSSTSSLDGLLWQLNTLPRPCVSCIWPNSGGIIHGTEVGELGKFEISFALSSSERLGLLFALCCCPCNDLTLNDSASSSSLDAVDFMTPSFAQSLAAAFSFASSSWQQHFQPLPAALPSSDFFSAFSIDYSAPLSPSRQHPSARDSSAETRIRERAAACALALI
jgi:hypothetical protein